MRRNNDDDLLFRDDDYVELRPAAPRFPVAASVAGVIWLIAGTFGLVSSVASLAGPNSAGAERNPVCGIIFAAAFAAAGYQTITGKAKDTRGNSVGSILLGLLLLGVALIAVTTPMPGRPESPAFRLIVGAVCAAIGLVGYILPGALALWARRDYLAWRQAQGDSDDRPRRRR